MNKKNMTKLGVSLGLVSALGVGATLAMLSNKTNELQNKFAMSDRGIGITLDEQKYGETGRTSTGNNYNDLVPGQTVVKDPTVTIEKNSLNCNVFVRVTNPNGGYLTYDQTNIDGGTTWLDITDKVDEVAKLPNSRYYVYKGAKATGTPDKERDVYGVIATTANDSVTLEPVFNNVTVYNFESEGSKIDHTFENITVKAAAVQADNVTDDEALTKALNLLNQ